MRLDEQQNSTQLGVCAVEAAARNGCCGCDGKGCCMLVSIRLREMCKCARCVSKVDRVCRISARKLDVAAATTLRHWCRFSLLCV